MNRLVLVVALLGACVRPAEDRALADLDVGFFETSLLSGELEGAVLRSAEGDVLRLWAYAPQATGTLNVLSPGPIEIHMENLVAGSELSLVDSAGAETSVIVGERPSPTEAMWTLDLAAENYSLRIGPPQVLGSWRFAVLGDIQKALPDADDIFVRMAEEPDLRFVISTGDLVEDGHESEYELFLEKLESLPIPFYSTIGNHELAGDADHWRRRFGRFTVHFELDDVVFSLVDTGNATIDPLVYSWLDTWLENARDRVHVFGAHYPAFDPVGVRHGELRSRREGAQLLSRLAGGEVDVTFYGHIHSYYSYVNAGIPAFISGGGGAIPERLDGIGRHFLVAEVDRDAGVLGVDLVRVDP